MLFYLALLRAAPPARPAGAALGLGVAIVIGISRVVVNAHSVPEVVAGCVLGGLIGLLFLRSAASFKAFPVSRWALAAGLLAVVAASYLKPVHTEGWIVSAALALSGHDQPFTRGDWKPRPAHLQPY